jgi:acetoacetyl-CoA synthetase
MSQPLWKPSSRRIEQANLTRFTGYVADRWGIRCPDYTALHHWSIEQPAQFWRSVWDFCGVIGEAGGDTVLEDGARMPGARWFPAARLNYAENLLRRHTAESALIFHGEDQVRRELSWSDLYHQVARLAGALRALGVREGDRVAAFMPNMPETVCAMLAAASIGAVWTSCSPDFGVQGVLDRFGQVEPVVLFCADGYRYNGKWYDSLALVKQIVRGLPSLRHTIIAPYCDVRAPQQGTNMLLMGDLISDDGPASIEFKRFPFDHPLAILFSSGTTGVPKCIVHGTGGTLLQHLKEHQLHTDIKQGDRFFYFTTCGWMMWNWLVSGLASGATLVLYDGSPFYPHAGTLFDLIDKERISRFGTSAKFIDAAKKAGLMARDTHSLETLETILSTGSPLAPESFDYVYDCIKTDVCLASISGGTDIISCFALGNPVLPVWRGELQCRGLGMKVQVFDDTGKPLAAGKGELVCTAPFPSMPVGFWNDPDGTKYQAAYFGRFPGVWCHGDYVALTEHGGMIVYGRSDTVLNPGGVRIGTAEIYRQVEAVDEVVESLVIAQQWEGDVRIVLFVRLRDGLLLDEALQAKIRQRIVTNTTHRHAPAKIIQVADIPRTRSGKIVELAVRNVVHGQPVRNLETLANPGVLELYKDLPELCN